MTGASENSHGNTTGIFDSPVSLLFPGQGAQDVGMGLDLYEASPAAREIFDKADEVLETSLTQVMFNGPAEDLERTHNAQPAILTVSLACLAAANEQTDGSISHMASFVAGHSLGEYTALAAADVLDTADAIWLVRERGRLMQLACEEQMGTMAAIIGFPEGKLEDICQEAGVQIANINCPGQLVISGEELAVVKAMEIASAMGAKRTLRLKVSGAFHSNLMGSALDGMAKVLETVSFRTPSIPVVGNYSGKPMTSVPEVKDELINQMCGCVRWEDSIKYMADAGVNNFIEFGPGNVLTGLAKRIISGVRAFSVNNHESAYQLGHGIVGSN